jgi:hypothetical protein
MANPYGSRSFSSVNRKENQHNSAREKVGIYSIARVVSKTD